LKADVEREALLEEEKKLTQALQKPSLNPEEANVMADRLKAVYQKLEEIEADKAESRLVIANATRLADVAEKLLTLALQSLFDLERSWILNRTAESCHKNF
jgi:ATP-binding cassette subfamily F protein 3